MSIPFYLKVDSGSLLHVQVQRSGSQVCRVGYRWVRGRKQ